MPGGREPSCKLKSGIPAGKGPPCPLPRGGRGGWEGLCLCLKLHVGLAFVAYPLTHFLWCLKHSPPRLVTKEALNTLVRINSLFFLRGDTQNAMLGSKPLSLRLDGGDTEALSWGGDAPKEEISDVGLVMPPGFLQVFFKIVKNNILVIPCHYQVCVPWRPERGHASSIPKW